MANATTKIADLINPEVMADMISAKIPNKIVVSPFAKVDTTLEGQAGDTITVPRYDYIGDAEDVAEGIACGTVKLTTTSEKVTVKKAMKAVELTDEAVLSGYGNPIGETNSQLAKAVASKMDVDTMSALQTSKVIASAGKTKNISYDGIVDAVDLFDEEVQSKKVIFVNPKQITQLRKDPDFKSADKIAENLLVTGAIGMIAGCEVVPSKKVELQGTDSAKFYSCPIVKLNEDDETEDEASAVTIFMKRKPNVETGRVSLARKTDVSVDEHYAVALTNGAKVVLAQFKG